LLEQFGLHVGIFDNRQMKVKLPAALGGLTQQPASLSRWQLLSTQATLAQGCLNLLWPNKRRSDSTS
ncbi:MAG: hypothetical protein Q8J60_00555, partial [Thiobacillus sp.]|nr:hypothetical protein [Thiobacillus sp.]